MTAHFTRVAAIVALLTTGAVAVPQHVAAGEPETTRTATKKVTPDYPEIARKGRLEGTVKLSVVVTNEGKVQTVKVIGGHPVLVQAASNAARQWQFEPAAKASNESLVFNFQYPR
jgi:TonB family protein